MVTLTTRRQAQDKSNITLTANRGGLQYWQEPVETPQPTLISVSTPPNIQTAATPKTPSRGLQTPSSASFYQPLWATANDYQKSVEQMNTSKYDKYNVDKAKFNQRLDSMATASTARQNRQTGLQFQTLLGQTGKGGLTPKASPTSAAWFNAMSDDEKTRAAQIKNPVERGKFINSLDLKSRAVSQLRQQQDETAARLETRANQIGPLRPTDNAFGLAIANYVQAGNDYQKRFNALDMLDTAGRRSSVNDLTRLDDNQKETIVKLSKSRDYQAISDYFDAIEYQLQGRSRESLIEKNKKLGYEHPIYSIIPEGTSNTFNGVPAILNTIYSKAKESLTGEWTPIDPNSHVYDLTASAQAIQEGASERIGEIEEEHPSLGNLARLARSGTSSALTNGLQLLAGGLVGLEGTALSDFTLAVMGTSAAGQAAYRELNDGRTSGEALTEGLTSGFIEVLTEKVSLDRFIKDLPTVTNGNAKQRAVAWMKMFATQGGIEGLEEVAGNIADQTFDIWYNGVDSEYSRRSQAVLAQKIMDNGGPERYNPTPQDVQAAREQAFTDCFVTQSFDAFVSALFSSFLLTGVPAGVSGIRSKASSTIRTVKNGNYLKANGNLGNELNKAEMFPGSKAAKAAEDLRETALKKSNQNVGGYKLGKLAILTNLEVTRTLSEMEQSTNPQVAKYAHDLLNSKEIHSVNLTSAKLDEILRVKRNGVVSLDGMTDAASDAAKTVAAQGERTQAENPDATVISTAEQLVISAFGGMKESTARKRAAVMERIISRKDVTKAQFNSIDPTNAKTRQIFFELTGVTIPDGLTGDALYQAYKRGEQERVKRVTDFEQRVTESVNPPESESEPISDFDTPAPEAIPAPIENTESFQNMRAGWEEFTKQFLRRGGRLSADNQILPTRNVFREAYAAKFPDATENEINQQYDQFILENQSIPIGGEIFNLQRFRDEYLSLRPNADEDMITQIWSNAVNEYLKDGLDIEERMNQEREQERKRTESKTDAPAKQPSENSGIAYTSANKPVRFHWAVVPAESLIISHDEYGNRNPDFPVELQPRDRSRAESQTQISGYAQNLNPALLEQSNVASDGTPIIRKDGTVVSGNARSAAIRAAYNRQNESGRNYANYIRENAERFGLDPEQIPDNPVLVRVADNVSDWAELARDLNVSSTASLSASETAFTDVERIADIIDLIDTDESGNLNSARNKEFISAFVAATPKSERNSILDEYGELSVTGEQRIKNAILAYAYDDNSLVSRFSESTNDDMKRITNALVKAAPKFAQLKVDMQSGEAYNVPVIQAVLDGLTLYSEAKKSRSSVAEVADQASLDTNWNTNSVLIAEVMEHFKLSAKGLNLFLQNLEEAVRDFGIPNQISLLGGTENATIDAAIDKAVQRTNEQRGTEFQRRGGQYGYRVSEPQDSGGRSESESRRPDGESSGGDVASDVERDGERVTSVPMDTEQVSEQRNNMEAETTQTSERRDYSEWENDFSFSEATKEGLDRLPDAEEKLNKLAEETKRFKAEVMDFFGTIADAPINSAPMKAQSLAEYWRGYFSRLLKSPNVFVNDANGSLDWNEQIVAGTRDGIIQRVFNGLAATRPDIISASFTLDLDNTSIKSMEGARILFEEVRNGHFDDIRKYFTPGMSQTIVNGLDDMYSFERAYQNAKQATVESLYGYVNELKDSQKKRYSKVLLSTKNGDSVTQAERIHDAVMNGAEVFSQKTDNGFSYWMKSVGAKRPQKLSKIAYDFALFTELQREKRDTSFAMDAERNPTLTQSLPDESGEAANAKPTVHKSKKTSREKSAWTTERVKEPKSKTLKSLSEIIEQARHDFGINITIGHIRGKNTMAQYNDSDRGIRTRIANDIVRVSHELGHHIDNKYKLTSDGNIPAAEMNELLGNLDSEFAKQYAQEELPGEAVAEYMRQFLTNSDMAALDFPMFTDFLKRTVSGNDLVSLYALADEVNGYLSLDLDNAQSSIKFSDEKSPDARTIVEKTSDVLTSSYQKTVDSLHSIHRLAQQYNSNFDMRFYNSAYLDSMADYILKHDLTNLDGQFVGKGLKTVLARLNLKDKNVVRLFNEYLVVKHGPECLDEGYRVFANPLKNNRKWMNQRASAIEQEHPEFKETSELLYDFIKRMYQTFAVDTGLYSQETLDGWWNRWNHYVPFHRDMSQNRGTRGAENRGGNNRGFANQHGPVKRQRGSGRDIIAPLDNIIQDLVVLVNVGGRNQAMLGLADAAKELGIDAAYMEQIPEPKEKQIVNARAKLNEFQRLFNDTDIGQAAKDMANDILGDMSGLMTQFTAGKASGDVVTVMRDGKAEYWKINDPELLESLQNLSTPRVTGLAKAFSTITRNITSNITGKNIVWSIVSNMPRDLQTYMIFTGETNKISALLRWGKAVGTAAATGINQGILKNGKVNSLYAEYLSMGGFNSSAYASDKKLPRNVIQALTGKSKLQRLNPISAYADFIEFASNSIEAGPRFATYSWAREHGMTPQEAFYAAMDVTVNFRRGGVLSRQANIVLPFFNASVQGTDKALRFFTADYGHEQNAAGKIFTRVSVYAMLSVIIGALIHGINHADDDKKESYERLSEFTKNNYFTFPVDKDKYYAVPKGRELMILESFTERLLDRVAADDKHAFDDFYGYVVDNTTPSVVGDILQGDVIGALGGVSMLGPLTYIGANRDFRGRPIVSNALKQFNNKDQYTRKTHKAAVLIGQATNISPEQIDFFMSNVWATPWKYTKALFPEGSEYRDITLGAKNSATKDSLYSTDIVNRAYDRTNKSQKDKNSNPDDIEKAILYKNNSNVTSFYSEWYKLAKDLPETDATRENREAVLEALFDYERSLESDNQADAYRIVEQAVKEVGDSSLLPAVMASKVKDGQGEERQLDGQQYLDYQTRYFGLYYDIAAKILPSATTASEKEAMLKQAKAEAQRLAKNEMLASIGKPLAKNQDKYATVSTEDYVKAKAAASGIESIKYSGGKKDGETVTIDISYFRNGKEEKASIGSESVEKALNIRRTLNLEKEQYHELFESLGIAKSVWNKSESSLESMLNRIQRKADKYNQKGSVTP